MTKDEALREAIDTLKSAKHGNCDYAWIDETIEKCTAALAQPEQEPVAMLFGSLPVYDTAAQRKPLTDEEIQAIWDVAAGAIPGWSRHIAYARAIEAAHNIGEKT